jgi:NADPH-dependent F420 reductase
LIFSIGIVGGTGSLGSGLAKRWSIAGHSVLIGSRDIERASQTASEISAVTGQNVGYGSNISVARDADIVVISVPFGAQGRALEEIKHVVSGKVVIDTTVPLVPPRVMRVQLPKEGCAALCAAKILGDTVRLVSAFHNVAASKLAADGDILCDTLVFGDDKAARAIVVGLANDAGLRGFHAGPLVNSVAAEALTSIQIFINKNYGIDAGGIMVTGEITKSVDE